MKYNHQAASRQQDSQEKSRQRATTRLAIGLGILMAITAIVTLLFGGTSGLGKVMGPAIAGVIAVVAFISAILNIRGHHNMASGFLLVMILVASIVTSILFSKNQGVALSIIVFSIIVSIASITLPDVWVLPVIIVGAIVAILNIFFDFYLPNLGMPTDPRYTNVIAALCLAIFLVIIARRFNQYTLQTKLVILFIAVALLTVGAISFPVDIFTQATVTQQVGQSIDDRAENVSTEISKDLANQVHLLQSESTNFINEVLLANNQYQSNQSPEEILTQIQQLDKIWTKANDNDTFILRILNNATADNLRRFQQKAPGNLEVFLTDKYGANIAATERTSNYYQGDEAWWQATYNNGTGAVYIGQPEFDQSANTYLIIMAVPVYQGNKAVGVLRSTLNVNTYVDLLQSERFGETGQVELRLNDNNLLMSKILNPAEVPALDSLMGSYGQIPFNGKLSFVSQVPVKASGTDTVTNVAINSLGWDVIAYQDIAEALQPVKSQTQTITLIAIGVAALAALLGLLASRWITTPILDLIKTTGRIASGDLSSRASVQTRDEIGTLANTFNNMTDAMVHNLTTLEERVSERTADLEISRQQSERRASELQAISEISRALAGEQRLSNLLVLITRLIGERFNFQHAAIFLLDETGHYAVLRAASSEGGNRMIQRGFKLEIDGSGAVPYAVRNGTPRIALDIGQDAEFFNNPDLPSTRSEIALPLEIRDQIIGVLDIQSNKPGAFTVNDLNTFSILADQVAIAIENARLFAQIQQALNESQALYRQNIHEGWTQLSREENLIGYQQSFEGGKNLSQLVESSEIRNVMNRGDLIVTQPGENASEPFMIIPIKLRGQIIGVLKVDAPAKDYSWTNEEVNLAEAVSERLSLALENARLIQESQRQLLKEQTISEVTTRIGASINLRNVLQTAVEELGRSIPGSEVLIRFEEE